MPPATQGQSDTIATMRTKHGQRFFLYRGQRFLVTGDGLCRAHLKVGDTFSQFHEVSDGSLIFVRLILLLKFCWHPILLFSSYFCIPHYLQIYQ